MNILIIWVGVYIWWKYCLYHFIGYKLSIWIIKNVQICNRDTANHNVFQVVCWYDETLECLCQLTVVSEHKWGWREPGMLFAVTALFKSISSYFALILLKYHILFCAWLYFCFCFACGQNLAFDYPIILVQYGLHIMLSSWRHSVSLSARV